MRDWKVWVLAGVMGLTAVFFQLAYLTPRYLVSIQVLVHQEKMRGKSGKPFQYRILSDYLFQVGLDAADKVFPAGKGRTDWAPFKDKKDYYILFDSAHFVTACLAFRVLQNIAILLLMGIYLGRLGISGGRKYAGMMALAWGLFFAFAGSDMQFNTYTDVIIFLLAGIALTSWDSRNLMWLIPISMLGAANRETSIFIPLLAMAKIRWSKWITPGLTRPMITWMEEGWPRTKRHLWVGLAALGVWAMVYGALVLAFPGQKLNTGFGVSAYGWEVFRSNFRGIMPWANLIGTMGIFPMLAVSRLLGRLGLKAEGRGEQYLRMAFWVMVPAWFAVMLFMGNVEETRIFLVPQAMVFIPLAMREER